MIDKKAVTSAVAEVLKGKASKKFRQSVDLAINFRDVDFNKPEERLNVDVVLPYKYKDVKVGVFADGQLALEAGRISDLVINSGQIPAYASDKKKQKELLNYSLLAAPQLMAVVGKSLGQVLATKGRLPKPIMPNANLAQLIDATRRTVVLKTKGKYLPALHCIVGNEAMPEEQVTENVLAVMEAVFKKVAEPKVKDVCVKLTMGKPIRVSN